MIVLLLGTHLFMTVRTGFIQRKTLTGIRLSLTKDPDSPGDVSQFQALTTALASTIGTGNIVGVGTAVFLGGPGAVLWCWLTGVFGVATKYAESLIAVKYRVQTKDGRMQGGAMYALERGLHMKWLGVVFAAFAMLASFGIGCGTQINAISEIIQGNSPIYIPPLAIGIVFAAITAVVIIGGIKSIAVVCERLVPLMAAFYVVGCVVILCINWDFILPALQAIFTLAFQPGAVAGGLTGGGIRLAMQYGVARGLFSNESGMGSAPRGRLGRTDAQSGAAGAGFLNWHVLGHGGGVSDDRPGAGNDCDEKPGHQHGAVCGRRPDDNGGVFPDSGAWAADSGGWHHHICLFHDSGLVVLRRALL